MCKFQTSNSNSFKMYNNDTKTLSTDLIEALKISVEESANHMLFEGEEIVGFSIPTALTEGMIHKNMEWLPFEIIKAFGKGYHVTKPGKCPEGCCVVEFENPNNYELAITYGFGNEKFSIYSIKERRIVLYNIFE